MGSNLRALNPVSMIWEALSARGFRRLVAVGPTVGVHPDLVPARTSQQDVDGRTELLTHDVPQRLLDAAQGGVELHRAASSGEVIVGHLGEVLDVRRAATDEVSAQLLYMRRHLQVSVQLGIALPPAVNPLIRLDFDKTEVFSCAGVYEEGLDAGYFQA